MKGRRQERAETTPRQKERDQGKGREEALPGQVRASKTKRAFRAVVRNREQAPLYSRTSVLVVLSSRPSRSFPKWIRPSAPGTDREDTEVGPIIGANTGALHMRCHRRRRNPEKGELPADGRGAWTRRGDAITQRGEENEAAGCAEASLCGFYAHKDHLRAHDESDATTNSVEP